MHVSALFCPGCGATQATAPPANASQKTMLPATILCVLLGWAGVHRMYVGKVGTGLLMLLTGGGFVIFWVLDLLNIVSGKFTDSTGAIIDRWTSASPYPATATSQAASGKKPGMNFILKSLLVFLGFSVVIGVIVQQQVASGRKSFATPRVDSVAPSAGVADSVTGFCLAVKRTGDAARCESSFAEKQITVLIHAADAPTACSGMTSLATRAMSSTGSAPLSGWRLLVVSPQGSASCRF